MRNITRILAASAIAFSAVSLARAADAIDEIPSAPESVDIVSSSNWEGAYIGGKLTHQWGKVKQGEGYDADGFGGGIYSGYNKQDGQIVYGGEVDLNYSSIDRTYNKVKADQGLNGSLRARLGYDLNPAMVYATGGLAATNLEVSDKTSDSNKTLLGLTIGAGVETKITDTITARTEYRFTNYQTQTFGLDSGNVDRGLKEHQLNVGLGVKF
ncbi:MAG: porin family protein [Rhizobiaceae bacterium]|nr:porin family protein [Rhizobiaceae bacterium]